MKGLIFCAFWAALTLGAAQADGPVVTDIALDGEDGGLRLEVVTDTPLTGGFTAFTLASPDRLVLDLAAAEWEAGSFPRRLPSAVSAVRHGLFRPDRFRIVIDLNRPLGVAELHGGAEREGTRVTLLALPSSRAAFDAASGWPEGARWEGPTLAAPGPGLVVAIDAGHGGIDPGAVEGELLEKDFTLTFALELARQVLVADGLSPVLIRETDVFVPLAERVSIARRTGAHLLVSIHADKLAVGELEGLSVYTLSEEGVDFAADRFAERENRADVLAGADFTGAPDDLARVLLDLARRSTDLESERLAGVMLREVRGTTALIPKRPHRRANFAVLRAPDFPSILIELGIMTSEKDRERLSSADWRQATAAAMVRAIQNWKTGLDAGFLAEPR